MRLASCRTASEQSTGSGLLAFQRASPGRGATGASAEPIFVDVRSPTADPPPTQQIKQPTTRGDCTVGPERPQEAPKRPPRSLQEARKKPPRDHQECSRRHLDASGGKRKGAAKAPKRPPRGPQETPRRTPRNLFNIGPNKPQELHETFKKL